MKIGSARGGQGKARSGHRLMAPVVLGAVLALVASACSNGAPGAASTPPSGATGLAAVCPNPVTIATDWTPEAEHGGYYELAASGGQIDTKNKTYTAPLVDHFTGKPTNVKVEILAGGPAVCYLQTPELLHQQPNILMGADDTDTAIFDSPSAPVIGIVAPILNGLQVLMWNPAHYHFNSIGDIGKSNATVLYFKGTGVIEYLAGAGYLKASQLDGSYTGNPARFVASGGGVVEQAFATAEPYIYTHELPTWDKSVAYTLTQNAGGYNPYFEMGEATPENVAKYAACFKQLVPMIQEAQIKYIENPSRVNQLIVQLVNAYGQVGGPYDLATAQYADTTLLADRLLAQPTTGAFGSFDMSRVDQLIGEIRPIMAQGGQSLPNAYSASSVVTNRFIDNSIKFTGYTGPYNDASGVVVVPGTK